MRLLRRRAAQAAIVSVIVAGALGAPATVASAARSRCPAGALGEIQTAYANVFSRATPLAADQRASSLADGADPAVRAVLDRWLASPVSANTTVSALTVHCPTRNRATVDAVLVLAGEDLPEVLPPGRARRQDGVWKVATPTFCARMVLEDPSLADRGVCAG